MDTGRMAKILYIDCFSGISGDMMVGALCDLGVDLLFLRNELKKLDITGYDIHCKEIKAGSIKAKKFTVNVAGPQLYRNFEDIKKIIGESSLDKEIKKISLDIFHLIAEAEAVIHDYDISKIHFHEVGAVDSIIDIVGTAIGLKFLKIGSFYSSNVPLGSGFVGGSHGELPVPAPATLEILKKVPVYGGNFDFEVTTPTGAAIIKTLTAKFGEIPGMEIEEIGYGAGSKVKKETPNILRLIMGTGTGKIEPCEESLILLSANIDDSTPEIIGYLQETLLKDRVLDVWIEPIYMKKNRPAFKLCVLCGKESECEIIDKIFSESTTLGIRREEVKRYSIDREIKTIKLPYGEVRIKTGIYRGKKVNISPEFESCSKLAEKTGKPLKEIYQDVILFFSRR
ncbi:MAG: nickel pincer cofactor biosynthesis protein LarC [Actinomycetota bacterium]|nr:nickel pincer cofactor biosynthesis protein LarC [Actinomycetota bacterium]